MSRCFNAAPPEVCPGPPVHGGQRVQCCTARKGRQSAIAGQGRKFTLWITETKMTGMGSQEFSTESREDVGRCGKMWEGKATNLGCKRRFLGWSLEWLRGANVNRARVWPWRGAWRGDRCVSANVFKKCLAVRRFFWFNSGVPKFYKGNKQILPSGYLTLPWRITIFNR
jgi:hypothetical protein